MAEFNYALYLAKRNAYGCYQKKVKCPLVQPTIKKQLINQSKPNMKKVFFLLVAIIAVSFTAFAQKGKPAPVKKTKYGYRVGLISSMPTDTYQGQDKIGIGSTFFEASYKYSKKVSFTANSGYLRYVNAGEYYAQIPVMAGVRYHIDEMFYFGASGGGTFYNQSKYGSLDFMYSPYVGIQAKRLSFDIRYVNTLKTNPVKTTALVFSYTL